jgi:hypothetical protein
MMEQELLFRACLSEFIKYYLSEIGEKNTQFNLKSSAYGV